MSHLRTVWPLCACSKKVKQKKTKTKTSRQEEVEEEEEEVTFGFRCHLNMTTRALAALPRSPRSTFGIFGVHLVGGYDRIQSQRGTSKRGCPFPFPGVSVVSPKKKMLVESPEEIVVFPIDQEENLEGGKIHF